MEKDKIKCMKNELDLRTGINYAIAGYLYKDGEILDVPRILRDMAEHYEREIEEESD